MTRLTIALWLLAGCFMAIGYAAPSHSSVHSKGVQIKITKTVEA